MVLVVVLGEMTRFHKDNKPMHSLGVLMLLSRGGDAYKWLCCHFIKCVVGAKQWSCRYHRESISEVATESDESFVLLTIENNYERWCEEFMLEPGDKDGHKNLPEAKYTNSGSSRRAGQGSSRRFHGWSKEGYRRFNALHGMIKEDRKRRANFEAELRERFEIEYGNGYNDDEVSDDDDEEIFPANDMIGVGTTSASQEE